MSTNVLQTNVLNRLISFQKIIIKSSICVPLLLSIKSLKNSVFWALKNLQNFFKKQILGPLKKSTKIL